MKTTNLALCTLLSVFFFSHLLQAETEDVSFWLTCPDDVTVYCTDYNSDLSVYGNAQYYTNYVIYDAGVPSVEFFTNGCNIGTIKRTWTVFDDYNNPYTCSQIITVTGPSSGDLDITFPEDVDLEGCSPDTSPSVTGYPTYFNSNPCAMIGVNFDDSVFHFGPQCTKIKRTWTVIDWCNFNPDLGTGEYVFNQVIKISENSEPEEPVLDTIFIGTKNCADAFVEFAPIEFPESVCGGDFSFSHLSSNADESGTNPTGTYPIGTHTFPYIVNFGCTGKQFVYQTVVVEDTSRPTPYCYGKLVTTLCPVDFDGDGILDDGEVEVWAEDFNFGSSNSCGNGDLKYSFGPDVNNVNLTLTCANLGENQLDIYVTDNLGNQSFCTVVLEIQNNTHYLPGCMTIFSSVDHDFTVNGRLSSFSDDINEIAEVKIKAMEVDTQGILSIDTSYVTTVIDSIMQDDGTFEYIIEEETIYTNVVDTIYNQVEIVAELDEDGKFSIPNVELGNDYTLEPQLTTFDASKITSEDVEILSEHIWGDYQITDDFALIAADMDDSGEVDEADFYILMQVFRTDQYPPEITTYWKTMNIDHYLITGEVMPMIYIEEFDSSVKNQNFFTVMKGDLNAHIDIGEVGIYEELTPETESEFNKVGYRSSSLSAGTTGFKAYPNPFADDITLHFDSNQAETVTIEVLSVIGKMMYNETITSAPGANTHVIQSNVFDKDGMYIINVTSTNREDSQQISVIKH